MKLLLKNCFIISTLFILAGCAGTGTKNLESFLGSGTKNSSANEPQKEIGKIRLFEHEEEEEP